MLPLFLLLSVLAFLDGTYAIQGPAIQGRWRPDMRRRLVSTGSNRLQSRQILEGIVTNLPPTDNSTILPLTFASDRQ